MKNTKIIYILEFPISNWVKDEIDEVEKVYKNFKFTTVGQFYKNYPDPNYIRPTFYHFIKVILYILFQPQRYLPIFNKYRKEVGIRIVIHALIIREKIKKYEDIKIHCHFASSSTTAALILHELYGYSYSFTAHAWDIYFDTINKSLLHDKMKSAYYIRTISEYNKTHLYQISPECHQKIKVIHCGINPKNYMFTTKNFSKDSTIIISASNLVEKKGYMPFIESLKEIENLDIHYRWNIAGQGPLKEIIEYNIQKSKLGKYIELVPSIPHENLQDFFDTGNIFFLPCTIASNGDRDGIPVILMEAMAAGIITISTHISGIPELIKHQKNGFLLKNNTACEFISTIKYIYTLSKNELDTIRKNARITIEQNFNIRSIVKNHLSFIVNAKK